MEIPDDASSIESSYKVLQQQLKKQTSKPLSYRIKQLQRLKAGVQELQDELRQALWKDLHRNKIQADTFDIDVVKTHIDLVINNLRSWARPQYLDTPVLVGPADSYVIYEPLGVVLIIGCWNFPIHLVLTPLIYAISAGNISIIKPSEISPNTSLVINKLINTYLDNQSYVCIQGGVKVITKLLDLRWDQVIFTGSIEKGKLVYTAAAKNLTPCIFELGGQCPAIIDKSANLTNAALRVVQGKFTNAGQICLAPDYLMIHKDIQQKFVNLLKETIIKYYGQNPQESPDYGRIVSQNHAQRLLGLLEGSKGQIIHGGKIIVQEKYAEPTLIQNPDLKSEIANGEIFGPLLPMYSFSQLQEAIDFVNAKEKPLAVYYFGCSSSAREVRNKTTSGSFVVNEAVLQSGNQNLPFGGVGLSGMGRYYGKFGFQHMSNAKSVFHKGCINIYPFNVRYPPFTQHKSKLLAFMAKWMMFPESRLKKAIGVIILAALSYYFLKHNESLRSLLQKFYK